MCHRCGHWKGLCLMSQCVQTCVTRGSLHDRLCSHRSSRFQSHRTGQTPCCLVPLWACKNGSQTQNQTSTCWHYFCFTAELATWDLLTWSHIWWTILRVWTVNKTVKSIILQVWKVHKNISILQVWIIEKSTICKVLFVHETYTKIKIRLTDFEV